MYGLAGKKQAVARRHIHPYFATLRRLYRLAAGKGNLRIRFFHF